MSTLHTQFLHTCGWVSDLLEACHIGAVLNYVGASQPLNSISKDLLQGKAPAPQKVQTEQAALAHMLIHHMPCHSKTH